jgi:hypothetical protein
MKLTLKSTKPRNPLVAATRFRAAGAHRRHGGAQRQAEQRSLMREMQHLRPSP